MSDWSGIYHALWWEIEEGRLYKDPVLFLSYFFTAMVDGDE